MRIPHSTLKEPSLFERKSVDSIAIIDRKRIDINPQNKQTDDPTEQKAALIRIETLDRKLSKHFHSKLKVQPTLTRQLVSFQANKPRPSYRWYKYKEAFSASLIEYLLSKYGVTSGKVLDPFAGSGTALFAASEAGINADGIELLPIGQQIMLARRRLEREFTKEDFAVLNHWIAEYPWHKSEVKKPLSKLRITGGAYPEETSTLLNGIWGHGRVKMSVSSRYYVLPSCVCWSQ
ncbi:MAG: DNA methyltransferase [Desulfovibrionales bacterium]|nr:DNA methyltransferase [Desulfovibrionales bacterium]